jgi:phosphoribosylamine--glycine ligase
MEALLNFAKKEGIDLNVVGPETPLSEGIVDRFREANLAILGPDKAAARLETSKVWAKSFMEKYGVTTARSRTFSDYTAALHYTIKHFKSKPVQDAAVMEPGFPAPPPLAPSLVIKADGLAAGKGVVVAGDLDEAETALRSFLQDASLGKAGKTVVLEEFLEGKEVSVLAAVSVKPGQKGVILPFIPARDHKSRFEGGKGPNTGGMGAIAPVGDFSAAANADVLARILKPTLLGMEQEGMDYRGFIFFGLMIKDDHCSLLEYNVRLGDPETQAVLPLMESDFFGLGQAILDGKLAEFPLRWKNGAVCAPVAVASGYPGAYSKGYAITVDEKRLAGSGGRLFIAGAEAGSAGLVSTGGRVLAASAWGADAQAARAAAYAALESVSFPDMGFRRDIGAV